MKFKDWEAVTPLKTGDTVIMDAPTLTKWNRFLYWLIKRPIPTTKQKFVVTEAS